MNFKQIALPFLLSLMVAISACKPDNPIEQGSKIIPDVTEVNASANGGTHCIVFTIENPVQGAQVEATTDASWINITSADITGIIFDVAVNNNQESRTAVIDLFYGGVDMNSPITVTQAAAEVPVDAAFIAIFDGKLANSSNKYFKVYDAKGNDISPVSRNVKLNGAAPAPYGSAKFELKAGTLKANSEYKMVIGAEVADVNGVIVNDPVTITFKTGEEVTSSLAITNNLDTLYFEGDKETSVGVTSVSTLRNTASKLEGLASNKLTYTFSETNGEAVYLVDDVTAIKGNDQSTFGMYVFGDYTFNTLYAKWAVEGDIQYTKICDLDYAGWLYQEANTAALPAGVDYQFMGFKIVRGTSFLSEKGEVSIDALRVDFQESIDSAVEDVVAPEHAPLKTIENGYLHILLNGVEYNAQGAVVK